MTPGKVFRQKPWHPSLSSEGSKGSRPPNESQQKKLTRPRLHIKFLSGFKEMDALPALISRLVIVLDIMYDSTKDQTYLWRLISDLLEHILDTICIDGSRRPGNHVTPRPSRAHTRQNLRAALQANTSCGNDATTNRCGAMCHLFLHHQLGQVCGRSNSREIAA